MKGYAQKQAEGITEVEFSAIRDTRPVRSLYELTQFSQTAPKDAELARLTLLGECLIRQSLDYITW